MGGRKAVRMTTGEVQEFLDTHLRAHVATLNRDGTIHLVPVHFARIGEEIMFWTDPAAQKAMNVRRSPTVSALIEDGGPFAERRGVSLQGSARIVEADAELSLRVGQGMLAKWSPPVDPTDRENFLAVGPSRAVVRIFPAKVISWDHRKRPAASREELGK